MIGGFHLPANGRLRDALRALIKIGLARLGRVVLAGHLNGRWRQRLGWWWLFGRAVLRCGIFSRGFVGPDRPVTVFEGLDRRRVVSPSGSTVDV